MTLQNPKNIFVLKDEISVLLFINILCDSSIVPYGNTGTCWSCMGMLTGMERSKSSQEDR